MTYIIRQPRLLINRSHIVAKLDSESRGLSESKLVRVKLIDSLTEAIKLGHKESKRRLDSSEGTGADTIRELSYLADQILRILFDYVSNQIFKMGVRTTSDKISLLAVGGYGRGELAPGSDLDLLFLMPYKKTPFTEKLVEYMLYVLWDLGFKVGYAVRTVEDNLKQAKADMTIRTALLESRWIWGNQALARSLQSRFRKEVVKGTGMAFVEAKLRERDMRHARLGDSRYVLEPNVKEDKGGLRDLHTLSWISKYLHGTDGITDLVTLGLIHEDAALTFRKAHEFLWTVRCHIHFITGRPDNRLTFDLQQLLAEHMGYTQHTGGSAVERFMKHYFLTAKNGGTLTRIFSSVLEEKIKQKPIIRFPESFRKKKLYGFIVEGGRLSVNDDACFREDPVNLLRIFHVAQNNSLDLHPRALELITKDVGLSSDIRNNQEANSLFMEILLSKKGPEGSLRLMNESGVFGRFIPDFGRVVAQMQFDMYHVYTTDEHTIRAIGMLYKIERGGFSKELPIVSSISKTIQSRRALYVAVFLHDIAKGRGGNHSKLGASVARKLCPRLGLTQEETETVEWLVLHHLLMRETAFKRDLEDYKTISDFCVQVQSLERLKLLLVLTCVDIHAVGPKVWNDWKASLLRGLYNYAYNHMAGGHLMPTKDVRLNVASGKLLTKLARWNQQERQEFMALLPAPYLLDYNLDAQTRYAEFIRQALAKGTEIATQFEYNSLRSITEMSVYAPDHPGLFAKIAGSVALSGLSIVDAKVMTLSNGMALDTFAIQDFFGKGVLSKSKTERLKNRLWAALEGRLELEGELINLAASRTKRFNALEAPPRVIIDNSASKVFSVFEINGHDRPGLLFDVTQAIAKLGLQISSAHISTYGERVVDVFYVKDIFGMKVENNTKLLQVRKSLEYSIGLKNEFSVLKPGKSMPNDKNQIVS